MTHRVHLLSVAIGLAASMSAIGCPPATAQPSSPEVEETASTPHRAGSSVGDPAPMFISFNEVGELVDMADLIDGRPLVLATGSCS
jgi:hypothetical protein